MKKKRLVISLFVCYNMVGDRMEKYKYYIMFAVVAMIVPIFYKMTITHHKTNYTIGNYQVQETFQIKNKEHYYQFQLKNKKEEYSYHIVNNAHKRKKIIKTIKEYKEGDLKCIVPIYKNTKEVDIYCRKNNIQTSNYSLKEDEDYLKILTKVKKYKIKNIETSNVEKKYKNIIAFSKNIPSDKTILIWDYKGVIGIQKDSFYNQKMIDYDLYDNIMATTTYRYFVLFENTSVNGIEKIYRYDLLKNKLKTVVLKEKISKDSYINGVENDLIYVTDKRKKKQYAINIKKETCKEVGNEEEGFIKYQNGKNQLMKISDFFSKNQYFHNERIVNKKITTSNDLIIEDDCYYFREEDNFYKQMKNGNRVFLFQAAGIEEWNVYQEDILLKKEDMLYLYNDQVGFQCLLEYNELKYNSSGIYYLWK